MTEDLEVLRIVASRLETAHLPYMVTGSVAANYYGVPRMTRDIDLVIEVSPQDAPAGAPNTSTARRGTRPESGSGNQHRGGLLARGR